MKKYMKIQSRGGRDIRVFDITKAVGKIVFVIYKTDGCRESIVLYEGKGQAQANSLPVVWERFQQMITQFKSEQVGIVLQIGELVDGSFEAVEYYGSTAELLD